MKRITFLALSLCLTMGVFAQNNFLKPEGSRMPAKAVQSFNKAGSTISNIVTGTEVLTYDTDKHIGFPVSFTVTMDEGVTKFFYDVYRKDAIENVVDTSSTYHTLASYIFAEAEYYKNQGYDYYETETPGECGWNNLWGNQEYEIYVLLVTEENGVVTDTTVITQLFTTPSSTYAGTPTVSISKTELTEDSEIQWNVSLNNTRQFYFLCEPKDSALYWLNNNPTQITNEQQSFQQELYFWLNYNNGQYASSFTFNNGQDINDYYATDNINNRGYLTGVDYVYAWMPLNGNNESGDFGYVVFKYAETTGLNDVVELSKTNIYPNPATDYVTVESTLTLNKVELYNTLGQVIYSQEANTNTVNIPVASLNNGTYFVKAYSDGMVVTKKVIVE